MPHKLRVDITLSDHVTAIAYPAAARGEVLATYILAHGAGGNQLSPWLVLFATAAAARGIGVVTFNFLYSEQGRGLPDKNDKLEACWRKVVEAWHDGAFAKSLNKSGGPLIIGGKSMGGRIASQIAAGDPDASPGMAEVAGLVFLGYPLHPPGKPEQLRSRHLPAIRVPMLFVQGARLSSPGRPGPRPRSARAPPIPTRTISPMIRWWATRRPPARSSTARSA
jgi:predicted alpha/beta-hydrolase family hydrolase